MAESAGYLDVQGQASEVDFPEGIEEDEFPDELGDDSFSVGPAMARTSAFDVVIPRASRTSKAYGDMSEGLGAKLARTSVTGASPFGAQLNLIMTKESAGEAWGILFKVKKFHKTKIVKVKRVEEGSHAMRCGLCTDDRIIAIDDEQVDFCLANGGGESAIKRMLDGETHVCLTILPDVSRSTGLHMAPGQNYADVGLIRKNAKKRWGCVMTISSNKRLMTGNVDVKGPMAKVGIRAGDQVLQINGKDVDTDAGLDVVCDQLSKAGLTLTLRIIPRAAWIREMHDYGADA